MMRGFGQEHDPESLERSVEVVLDDIVEDVGMEPVVRDGLVVEEVLADLRRRSRVMARHHERRDAWASQRSLATVMDDGSDKLAEIVPTRPLLQLLPLVGTHEPEELAARVILGELFRDAPRPGRGRETEIRFIDPSPGELARGEVEHIEALLIRRDRRVDLERGLGAGKEDHAIESAVAERAFGNGEMPRVNRVKGAAK
jgi:hypothetical protein